MRRDSSTGGRCAGGGGTDARFFSRRAALTALLAGRDAAGSGAFARCERCVRAHQLRRLCHETRRPQGPGGDPERLGGARPPVARPRLAAVRHRERPRAGRARRALPAQGGRGNAHDRLRPQAPVVRHRSGRRGRRRHRQHGDRLLPRRTRPRLQPHGGAGGAARRVVEVPGADPLGGTERRTGGGHRRRVSAAQARAVGVDAGDGARRVVRAARLVPPVPGHRRVLREPRDGRRLRLPVPAVGRVGPLVVAHSLLDIGAFVGYAVLAGKVGWLPTA